MRPWRLRSPVNDVEFEHYAKRVLECPNNGDVIVAGTYLGADVVEIAKAFERKGLAVPHIVVIDSFRGLAEPHPLDIEMSAEPHKKGDLSPGGIRNWALTLEENGVDISMEVHKIWIDDDTLKKIAPRPIRFMILDLDHYLPVLACLKRFYPWVLPLGWVISHDVGWKRTGGVEKALHHFNGIDSWTRVKGTWYAERQKDAEEN